VNQAHCRIEVVNDKDGWYRFRPLSSFPIPISSVVMDFAPARAIALRCGYPADGLQEWVRAARLTLVAAGSTRGVGEDDVGQLQRMKAGVRLGVRCARSVNAAVPPLIR